MALDPSKVFTQLSGEVAAVLGVIVAVGVLAVFAVRIFGFQKKFPGPPRTGDKDQPDSAPQQKDWSE